MSQACKSVFSALINKFLRRETKRLVAETVKKLARALIIFDGFCADEGCIDISLTKYIVSKWMTQKPDEPPTTWKIRKNGLRRFSIFLAEAGYPVFVSIEPCCRKAAPEYEFKSPLAESIKGLISAKRTAGFDYGVLNEFGLLRRFDTFCLENNYAGDELTQQIVELWSLQNEGEGLKSRSNRMIVIRQLATYMLRQGKKAYVADSCGNIPHPFPYIPSDLELKAVFSKIDHRKWIWPWMNLVMPMVFRLMLCCGLRISEACKLRRNNFNAPKPGWITIQSGKGHKDRAVILASDVLELCSIYDTRMNVTFPYRKWFFPGCTNPRGYVSATTVRNEFTRAWNETGTNSSKKPTPHSLRHAFVINTVDRWRKEKSDPDKLIPYLSRYIGHCSIQDTYHYYQLLDREFPSLLEQEDRFNAIVPEVDYEK